MRCRISAYTLRVKDGPVSHPDLDWAVKQEFYLASHLCYQCRQDPRIKVGAPLKSLLALMKLNLKLQIFIVLMINYEPLFN